MSVLNKGGMACRCPNNRWPMLVTGSQVLAAADADRVQGINKTACLPACLSAPLSATRHILRRLLPSSHPPSYRHRHHPIEAIATAIAIPSQRVVDCSGCCLLVRNKHRYCTVVAASKQVELWLKVGLCMRLGFEDHSQSPRGYRISPWEFSFSSTSHQTSPPSTRLDGLPTNAVLPRPYRQTQFEQQPSLGLPLIQVSSSTPLLPPKHLPRPESPSSKQTHHLPLLLPISTRLLLPHNTPTSSYTHSQCNSSSIRLVDHTATRSFPPARLPICCHQHHRRVFPLTAQFAPAGEYSMH